MSNLNNENNEEEYDFEIVCPYCENEFLIDLTKNKIECLKCKNIIELEWTGNMEEDETSSGCSGRCSRCKGCEDDM